MHKKWPYGIKEGNVWRIHKGEEKEAGKKHIHMQLYYAYYVYDMQQEKKKTSELYKNR